jgi:midasin (ATPase involved in ribosome maturation)
LKELKVLSRAFRNRFLELEFDDIPEHELEEILCLRCEIPPSYGAKIVEVYKVPRPPTNNRIFRADADGG